MALFREPSNRTQTPAPEFTEPEKPYRDDACPSCGHEYFTPGGPVVTCRSNGEKAVADTSGAVLSCLGCGERWYQTRKGLKKPADGALPPAWAQSDLYARVKADQVRRGTEREERPAKRLAGPHEGFALPPKV